MASEEEVMEEQVRSALLAFVDFLWAVVFGIIVAQLVEQVIIPIGPLPEKASKVLLVIGVFYFLTWDWLHGRLLTLKNPYRGYRRFFIEVMIAFCGYGTAKGALQGDVTFLIYIGLILLLGVGWATMTLYEYPNSPDKHELDYLTSYQLKAIGALSVAVPVWQYFWGSKFAPWDSIVFCATGMLFVFIYELEIIRDEGLLGGPGVPFVSRQFMSKARYFLTPWR